MASIRARAGTRFGTAAPPDAPGQRASKRIVLTTFGSLGDLHPYLAIARGLQARGHAPVIATSPGYRETVAALGLEFRPIRPDLPDAAQAEALRRVMDQRRGSEEVIRRWVLPALRESYDDLLAATEGADLIVSHLLTYAAPLVAAVRGLPWVSTVLQPGAFVSVHDPPAMGPPPIPTLTRFSFLGPWFWRGFRRVYAPLARRWFTPLHQLSRELGLPATDIIPLWEGYSPWLVLALFSPLFAQPQPDWPPQTVTTGFPFFDPPDGTALPPELNAFLAAGEPPLVFTLGSAAVLTPGSFYEASRAAAARLGRRAVLLVGAHAQERPRLFGDDIIAAGYAPYTTLFPRAAAIVHSGGIGTTAQALRAGRPMLVVPFAHDQPDNARRVERLGVGRAIPRDRYDAETAARELRLLLDDPMYAQRAALVGQQIRQEDGVGVAAAALERLAQQEIAHSPRPV